MSQVFYTGCVENRLDPLKLGRCQVRVLGLHTENKIDLPTIDLPWAYPMMPVNSASISGLGWSPTGVVQGTWVIIIFMDEDQQQPIMLGTLGGIPQTKSSALIGDLTGDIVTTDADGVLTNTSGYDVTDIVDTIAAVEPSGKLQETSEKHHINSVSTETSEGNYTTFNIISNETNQTIATATFDENTSIYSTTLTKPDQFEQSQYLPFKGGSLPFTSTQEILKYFDANF